MNKFHKKGFTLIELLVVIAIIGILAALVLVALGNARDKANDARVKSDIGQLRTLAEVLYDSNNASYNNGTAGVDACFSGPSSTTCAGGIEDSVTALTADLTAAVGAGAALTVVDSASDFCISHNLKSSTGTYICVDSSGQFKDGLTVGCTATACP